MPTAPPLKVNCFFDNSVSLFPYVFKQTSPTLPYMDVHYAVIQAKKDWRTGVVSGGL